MMKLDFSRNFKKQINKLPPKKIAKAKQAIDEFLRNPDSPKLRYHSLKGDWLGYESISAGGDLRLHFKIADDMITFVAAGTHGQLYK